VCSANCPVENSQVFAYYVRMKRGLSLLIVFLFAVTLRATVQLQKIEYRVGDTVC
jgi:hypothetical protein